MRKRQLLSVLAVCLSLVVIARIVQAVLSDDELFDQVALETSARVTDVAVPDPGVTLSPVQRVPRDRFGIVGPAPLDIDDLQNLVFSDADLSERIAVVTGLAFFTLDHRPGGGGTNAAGALNNQPNCLGCHLSSAEAVAGLVTTPSQASRAGRSSPTNFAVTGQGRAPDDNDAVNNTGKTAAFTIFGDFNTVAGTFNNLNAAPNNFFGPVQHVRPARTDLCRPDRLPSIGEDTNLTGLHPIDGWMQNWTSPNGFRRQVAERAAPPYIGRGLMEAIPNADILALADPAETRAMPIRTRISGRANTATTAPQTIPAPAGHTDMRLGRFGLRAQGPQLIVFPSVGAQEEVGTTSRLRPAENAGAPVTAGVDCTEGDGIANPDIPLSTIFSLRSLVRMTAPPEFGDTLLDLLREPDPTAKRAARTHTARNVQLGARLFGVDLIAFANRMIPGRMPAAGDGLDRHARLEADADGDENDDVDANGKKIVTLNCAGCHTPVHRTGQSPADVGARHLSFKWAPIFSDMLLHNMPVIDAERLAPTPRLPLQVRRGGRKTFDLSRNFGEDALPNQGTANGDEFRTAPLMALGRMGPPFMHDSRIYLSRDTANTAPASTVTAHKHSANIPLVVRTIDDAIRAAIELHDLPAPRPGCPVPPAGRDGLVRVGDVVYGSPDAARQAICPPLDANNRSEAREVIGLYRALSEKKQQALIDFLKEL
jgi:hypothetical protein